MSGRFLASWKIRSDSLKPRKALAHQQLVQSVSSDHYKAVVARFFAAASGRSPMRPNGERLFQGLAHKFFGLPATFHGLVQRDSKILALLPGPIGILEISFRCINEIEPQQKFVGSPAHAKTIAIGIRMGQIVAIR